jgi:hypothetical protein
MKASKSKKKVIKTDPPKNVREVTYPVERERNGVDEIPAIKRIEVDIMPDNEYEFGKMPKEKAFKKATPEQIKKLQDEVDRMAKMLKQMTIEQKDPAVKIPKVLDTMKFNMESPFILLPQLSNVNVPSKEKETVSVGSIEWLHIFDQLITAGWPYYGTGGIEAFLLNSAWIVKQELNYTLLFKEDGSAIELDDYLGDYQKFKEDVFKRKKFPNYRNKIVQFCMWYPDVSRQEERMQEGYGTLVKDLRKHLGARAFIPETKPPMEATVVANKGKSKGIETVKAKPDVCPPVHDVTIGDIKAKNFLRNWTEVDTNTVLLKKGEKDYQQVRECRVPNSMRYSWIPIEYRRQVEELYNLVQFKYAPDVDEFKTTIYNLLKHNDNPDDSIPEELQFMNKNEERVMFMGGTDGKGYIVSLAYVNLNWNPRPKREGVKEGEHTLREWLLEKMADWEYYPLIFVIMNIPPPKNHGTPESPGLYSRAGYIHKVKRNGLELERMYSDAPVKAFRDQMIEYYVNKVRKGESYDDCLERFIKGVYEDVKRKDMIAKLPPGCPEKYRNLLTELFEYGGDVNVCSSDKVIVSNSNIKPPTKTLTKEEIESLSKAEINNMLNKILKDVKQSSLVLEGK